MKKLLSILAVVGLTATASTSVVACSSSSDKNSGSSADGTDTIIKNSSLGEITSSQIMQDLLNKKDWPNIYGDQGTATKNFMNYFAEAFMNYVSNFKDEDSFIAAVKKANPDFLPYIDDGMFDAIKSDYTTRTSNAKNDWSQAIKDAKSKYGKKWESSWLKDLQSQFGDSVYVKGSSKNATSYEDYKDTYISNALLTGTSSNSSSIYTSLQNDIYLWGKTPKGQTDISTALGSIKTQIFGGNAITLGKYTIDFSKNNTAGKNALTTDRAKSWFGQMDNLLNGLKDAKADSKSTGDTKTLLDYVVNMYNITGGLNANKDTQVNGKDTSGKTKGDGKDTFNVSKIKWATEDNLLSSISNVTDASNELIQRLDRNYDIDFGENATSTTSSSDTININPMYDFRNKVTSIYTGNQTGVTDGTQNNGLFSNAQRFVANDYYTTEKPVAISEVVVSPIQSDTSDWSQQITNKGFVGNNVDMTNQLYNFIGNFIDGKGLPDAGDTGTFTKANTDTPDANTDDYSWDSLMSGTWTRNVANDTSWSSDFQGKVKFTDHDNLLTVDSSSSDFSDLLKYSVYDYLSKGTSANYKWDAKTVPDNKVPNQVSVDSIKAANANSPLSKDIDSEYNVITNFIQSLSRSSKGTSKKMYQVVNAKQGIIAFLAKDGIHFVRIEGYGILSGDQTKLNVDQTKLTTSDFNDPTKGDSEKASFSSLQTLGNALSDQSNTGNTTTTATKNSAVKITNDYGEKDTDASNKLGVTYSDLNKGFGNKYLQFLANSSIPKSLGYSSPKYKYDLNSLLKSYASTDITTDNLLKSSSMSLMVWDYAKELLGKSNDTDKETSDQQMYDWVFNGGSDTAPASQADALLANNLNGNADAGKSIGNWSESLTNTFKDDYKYYISTYILNNHCDEISRLNRSETTFQTGMKSYDDDIDGTTWTDNSKAMEGYHPDLKWSDVLGASSVSSIKNTKDSFSDSPDNSSAYYDQMKKIYQSKIWAYDSTSANKMPAFSARVIYNITMSNFIPNDFALKGDEE